METETITPKEQEKIIQKIYKFRHDAQIIYFFYQMDFIVFHELLLSAFEKKNFRIDKNTSRIEDDEINSIIYDENNNKILVQVKRHQKKDKFPYCDYGMMKNIKKKDIDKFQKLVEENKCKGYLIHIGNRPIKKVIKEAKKNNITVFEGKKLIDLITTDTKQKKDNFFVELWDIRNEFGLDRKHDAVLLGTIFFIIGIPIGLIWSIANYKNPFFDWFFFGSGTFISSLLSAILVGVIIVFILKWQDRKEEKNLNNR